MLDYSILIMLHCEQNTGYAIESLEGVFEDAALLAGFAPNQIFWSYSSVVDSTARNVIDCMYRHGGNYPIVEQFVARNSIKIVLAFDLTYPAEVIGALRRAGVEYICAYWGASMSSINLGLKLWIKKLEWQLRRNKPDFFIFESCAMQLTATSGRGVPAANTAVIPLGVDTDRFFPEYGNYSYAHELFDIPVGNKIVFYSGHMEERKGVRVIVQAAIHLIEVLSVTNVHFVICGDKPGEADVYKSMLENSPARSHVIFAGYRQDVDKLMRSSAIGIIASTGWDSFTLSSVEMMASGLPLIVSRLQGLTETINEGGNGYFIDPGDFKAAAEYIKVLAQDISLSRKFSLASRARAVEKFSRSVQVESLAGFLLHR